MKVLFIGGPWHGVEREFGGDRINFTMPRGSFEFGELIDEFEPIQERPYRDGTYTKQRLGVRYGGNMFTRDVMVRDGLSDLRAAMELRELLVTRWIARQALT